MLLLLLFFYQCCINGRLVNMEKRSCKEGEYYFVCRLCKYWTDDEDEMVHHISTCRDVSKVKDGISDAFARFPKRIDSIYDGIELCPNFSRIRGLEPSLLDLSNGC